MPFYLYWDESSNGDESKIVRSTYSTLKEAKAQAEHDLKCGQCDGTGKEASSWGPQKCRVCSGSGESASRNILYIEESDVQLGGNHRSALARGKQVWTREKK